jgi:hypothetical protein
VRCALSGLQRPRRDDARTDRQLDAVPQRRRLRRLHQHGARV